MFWIAKLSEKEPGFDNRLLRGLDRKLDKARQDWEQLDPATGTLLKLSWTLTIWVSQRYDLRFQCKWLWVEEGVWGLGKGGEWRDGGEWLC